MRKSRSVSICGGGVVGLCCAYYLTREGYRVAVIERGPEGSDSCVHGSAGYISPSHVIPLAAPGIVWKGMKWMMNPRSPFYIKPRIDGELMLWGWLFARACTQRHTDRVAPVLRDLCLGNHELFVEFAADEYVLTGGSWSPAMVAGLGLRLPMQPGKGYSLTIEKPRLNFTKSLILTERRVAVTPMGAKLRFGGTMEISGHSDNVRPERVQQIIAGAKNYFPELTDTDFEGVKPWFGYRPVSPDGLPYIGRFGRYKNLTTASGHAMLGLTMAPISGLLVADILTGRKPRVDLSMLNPDRYA